MWFTSTSTDKTVQDSKQEGTASNRPVLDAEVGFQRNFILDFLRQMISNGGDFSRGYEANGLANIDRAGQIQNRMAQNFARSRGIGNTTAGGAIQQGAELDTLAKKTSFLNELPMFNYNLQRQQIGDLGNFVNAQPYGQNSQTYQTGNQTTNSTSTRPGGIFQDLLGAASGIAGSIFGGGLNFGRKKPNSGMGDINT